MSRAGRVFCVAPSTQDGCTFALAQGWSIDNLIVVVARRARLHLDHLLIHPADRVIYAPGIPEHDRAAAIAAIAAAVAAGDEYRRKVADLAAAVPQRPATFARGGPVRGPSPSVVFYDEALLLAPDTIDQVLRKNRAANIGDRLYLEWSAGPGDDLAGLERERWAAANPPLPPKDWTPPPKPSRLARLWRTMIGRA